MKSIASAIQNIGQYRKLGSEEHWAVKKTGQYKPLLEISARFFPGVGARIAVEGIAASFASGCGNPVSQGGA